MEAAFWHERWDKNLIGFHLDDVNPYLQKYWPVLDIQPGKRVFVPLCGKSVDLLWLAGQGYEVVGVEISPIAVESFFQENDLLVDRSQQGNFEVWQSESITIFCGDFFDLTDDMLAGIDAIYDRASLVALPEPMRNNYASHIKAIMPEAIPALLVTLSYDQELMSGPPFSVKEEEIQAIYQDYYQLRRLCSCDVIEDNSRFRDKGLTELLESVYLLNKK